MTYVSVDAVCVSVWVCKYVGESVREYLCIYECVYVCMFCQHPKIHNVWETKVSWVFQVLVAYPMHPGLVFLIPLGFWQPRELEEMDEGIATSLVPRNWVPGQPPTASTDGSLTGRPLWSCKPCITPEVPTSMSFLATWPQARDYAVGLPGTQIFHSQEKFCGLPWMGAAPTAVDKTS